MTSEDRSSEQVSPELLDLLKLVYREFLRMGDWPTGNALQKLVWRSGTDVEKIVGSTSEKLVMRDYSKGGAIKLRLAGFIACGDAGRDLDNFARVLRFLVTQLDEPTATISTADMVQKLGMDEGDISRMRAMLEGEYLLALTAQNDRDGKPYVWKAADDAWRFAKAESVEEYVRLKDDYLNPKRTQQFSSTTFPGTMDLDDLRDLQTASAAPTTREIFIAYPWSAYPNRLDYKNVFTGLEEELAVTFVFAESRLSDLHVLDKIEEMITRTAFGIYDLTRWNPNVTLEYGYARGLGRQAFIAFNPTVGDSTDVPADIRGYDRIQYDNFVELATEVRRLVIQQLGPPHGAQV